MIGERLAEIRKDHGDKQYDLALKLKVSVSTVRKWEHDINEPSHDTLCRICRMYNVSADYLLGLNNDDPFFRKLNRTQLTELENYTFTVKELTEFAYWKNHRK